MSNMSATILRNLVASVFNVQALNVRISGQIDPTWSLEYTTGIAFSDHTEEGEKHIWGYSPQTGFVEIPAISQVVLSRGNHDKEYVEWYSCLYGLWNREIGDELLYNQYQFFLVESGTEFTSEWTIYGGIDFGAFRNKVSNQLDNTFNHIIEDTW